MIRETHLNFYILMYQYDNGETYWWGLYDSLSAAAEDGPECYESRTRKNIRPDHKEEIEKSLLKRGKYYGELHLWIDIMPLCTNKEK